MGVVKVETLDVTVSSNGQTQTITNVGSTSDAFIRNTNWRNMSGGPTGNTSNAGPDELSVYPAITSTTQVTFTRPNAITQRYMAEVWRYTGAASGSDEFIRRGSFTVSLGTNVENNSVSVSGITNRNKCICFITGKHTTTTSNTVWQEAMAIAYIDASNNLVVSRQDTNGGALDVRVDVVEFTGENWTVGYYRGAFASGAPTIVNDSRGNTGSAVDVGAWSNAIIMESQLEGDSGGNNAIEDRSYAVTEGSSSTTITTLKDSTSANDGDMMVYVLSHPGMNIARSSASKSIPNNGTTDTTLTFPSITISDITEAALEFSGFSDGSGTAHARGALSGILTGTSQITTWVHRSGNTGTYRYGVVDLSALNNLSYVTVSDVDTDEVIGNAQLNVVVTGANFEATQGTGKVELVQNSNYSGTIVNQTSIDSWSDTSIQFDVSAGALADTNCFLFITNNSGDKGFIAVQVGVPPETYQEALEGLTPAFQHYWTFQNTYADEVGTATANNSSGGTPSFSTTPIVKGDTHSFLINSTTEYISPADQSDMNTSSIATRRMMAGWIMVTGVLKEVAVIWEEGAQVNNYAWLIGFGNNLMIQFADDGGDYVQVYFPFTLTPNRPYHVYMEFNGSGQNGGICKGYLDGVVNVRSNGNPWEVTTFPSHSGNISWGHEGTENLQVGDSRGTDNVDVAFASPVSCHYAHFVSLQQNEYSATQIRETFFEKGALATTTISNNTTANMQTAIDAEADTLFTDYPCALEIGQSTDETNFELVLDNITFEDRVSMQIRYMGANTLTLVTTNGTVLDTNKLGAPYGGTITVVNAVPVKVVVLDFDTKLPIQNARVLLEAGAGGPLTEGDDIISGLTDVNGEISANLRYSSDQPVTGRVRKSTSGTLYKTGNISSTVLSNGRTITVFMINDE